ncbi:Mucin-associated surface protein (MASP) [Trypanosoma cruzi]|uniref:Mucin-associated surface protein (MASP), putative n=2 Tax=Trypanosoma cruzi TaxID=5693 RepID=Q4D0A4_TRYCC|nr:mucin-associated surface protein (MASP), putative [Trypanosoma cruzi]EAN85956.1 mucin-associated surface protein (MASP), putative [Trypanosoma cruzi]PWV20989.1 Mucin-associated surface protein (MASP) [Trypanosoma cruzi]RNC38866.1 mucin-associated surface protein (MASP) [Trypanosoma cruzi]|eukprot:XP_807807.1 mucin-associated surface protein (MASP) [Trypanosoma cruzi strain CL Brener]
MAMMTGRVLLVCALCVLWCGAGGSCEEEAGAPVSGGVPPPAAKELETAGQGTKNLKVGSPDIEGKVIPAPSPPTEEAEDEDSDEEEETAEETEKDKKGEKEKNKLHPQTHESQNNEGAPPPPPTIPSGGPAPSSTAGEGGPLPDQENLQKLNKAKKENTPSRSKTDSEAPEPPPGDATQGQHNHDTDTKDSTKNAAAGSPAETTTTSSTSTSGSGDHAQNKADEVDAQSSEEQHESLEIGNSNVVPPLSERAPKTARTTTDAQTNGTVTKVGESDGSTAVSHTTSPLLLLLLVACAAAAVAA